MSHPVSCPACKFSQPILIGEIPVSDYFTGRQLPYVLHGGSLYRCPVCHLHFRYPRLPQAVLDDLYRETNSIQWKYDKGIRRDWELAAGWLKNRDGGNILDVGCWDGKFLSLLPSQWDKFGIEINPAAIERAKRSGVKIIGADVYQADDSLKGSFEVVTAFDILEHIHDVGAFLEELIDLIQPGGIIFIGTGNTDAWTWKIAKGRHMYCWTSEHISFVNRAWFEYQSGVLPLQIREMKKFSHSSQPSIPGLISQSLSNFLYLYAPSIFFKIRMLRWKLLGALEMNRNIIVHPPAWNKSKDHLFVVLQKISP